jgi:AraC-like DNA-binding protein
MRHEGRQRAITLVADTDLSFKEIAYRLGFRSQGNFSTAFRDAVGETP